MRYHGQHHLTVRRDLGALIRRSVPILRRARPTLNIFFLPPLPVLRAVTEERNTYGLRHQDFLKYRYATPSSHPAHETVSLMHPSQRAYRSHCTRKIHNLRKAVGLSQTQGKAKKYAKKDVISVGELTSRSVLFSPPYQQQPLILL